MFLQQLENLWFSNTLGTVHNRMEREKTPHAVILPALNYNFTAIPI